MAQDIAALLGPYEDIVDHERPPNNALAADRKKPRPLKSAVRLTNLIRRVINDRQD
jgi:hypothetical protein